MSRHLKSSQRCDAAGTGSVPLPEIALVLRGADPVLECRLGLGASVVARSADVSGQLWFGSDQSTYDGRS
jgi:hypothetical protein